MDLITKINELTHSQEMINLNNKINEFNELKLHEIDLIGDIHFLLGKYKKGVELVKINNSSAEYGKQEILFSRIGIRYKTYYESYRTPMNLASLKNELKNKAIVKKLNKNLKPEGQQILKYLINEMVKIGDIEKFNKSDLNTLTPINMNEDVYNMLGRKIKLKVGYPCIDVSFNYSAFIGITFGGYDSIPIGGENDIQSIALKERYYKELLECMQKVTEKINKINKEIDDVNIGFKTTFAKYLLIKEI